MVAEEKLGELTGLSIEKELASIIDLNALIPNYAEKSRARRASCKRRDHEGELHVQVLRWQTRDKNALTLSETHTHTQTWHH